MTAGGSARDLIDGRFELLERLGGGGMGLVWRARDTMLQREVALKEVRSGEPAVYDDPVAAHVMRERVLREARALARLHHPNVVTIYHIVDSVEQRHPWLVMELVTGGSLDDRLKRGPLPPQEVAHIGRGVLAALRAAHAAGIQHRDVKPANVLLRPDGTPVLTDFGIAALRESTGLTATGALIGSPEYIAPERIRGHEGDSASDLWSLGMMMYVAVEGHNPLRRDTPLASLAAVLDAQIPEPTRAGPLKPVLAALLVRDPASRPDAAQLDHMFAAAEQGAISAMYGSYGNQAGYGSYGNAAASYPSAPPVQSSVPPFGPSGAAYGPVDASDAYAPSDSGYVQSSTSQDYLISPGVDSGTGSRRRPRRRRRAAFIASITGTAVLGLAVALVWTLRDLPARASTNNDNLSTGGPSAPSSPSSSTDAAGSSPTGDSGGGSGSGQPPNYLTAAGARSLVSLLHQQFGSRKIVSLDLYPTYIDVEVETAADPTLYDDYWYRGLGFEAVEHGTISDELPVDLNSINWNLLPTLLADAAKVLKVPHPTSTYVVIEGNFIGEGPGIAVYLSDTYGSGYLLANLKGDVVFTDPHS